MVLNGRVAVNLWTIYGWEPSSFELDDQVVARIAAAGASGVELVVDERELTCDRLLSARSELSSLFAAHDLEVSGVASRHIFAHNPASQSAEVRGRALRGIRAASRVAREFGASTVVVIPGFPERRVPYEATYDAAAQTLAQAGRYAEDDGVTITVENAATGFLQSPREFCQFLDEIDSPAVRACLDLGNVLAANQPFPENWILTLAERIALVHAKDYEVGIGGGTRPCGGGAVPWTECIDALTEVGYDGALVVETPPAEGERVQIHEGLAAMEASVRFLAGALARVPASEASHR